VLTVFLKQQWPEHQSKHCAIYEITTSIRYFARFGGFYVCRAARERAPEAKQTHSSVAKVELSINRERERWWGSEYKN
jgi:hypothetical protein